MQTSVKERGGTSLLSILKLREYSKEIFYLTKFSCCLSSIRNFKNMLKQIYYYTWCIYDIRYHSNSRCMLSTLYHVSPWYMVKSLVSLNEWPASYDHLSFSMNRINVITEVVTIFSLLSHHISTFGQVTVTTEKRKSLIFLDTFYFFMAIWPHT